MSLKTSFMTIITCTVDDTDYIHVTQNTKTVQLPD